MHDDSSFDRGGTPDPSPVISLNMASSVPAACDLVVSDPVQAGVMAVMAVAETAKFNLHRLTKEVFESLRNLVKRSSPLILE